MGYFYMIY